MKRLTLFLLLAFVGGRLFAQAPSGYYNNADGKTGDELKLALHNIIKGHHEVSYSDLLDAFAYTDCKPNGKIWDIYSNYEYNLNQNGSSFSKEGDGWNREHTWPQSWFHEQTTPRCDLFHVYPTDGYVNNCRSSYPYGEVSNPVYTSGNGSKLGPCSTSGYSGSVFEPIDEYKGDIARGFFYMSVRYYGEDSGWSTSGMTNKSEILPWAMTMLLRWSDEDPVSDKETARNNAVYGYQNNRNPFIDHPEYAHMIWDPDWSGMPHTITCATGLSHGSISAPSQAVGGTIVTLTAMPDPGYELDTWTVTKADDSSVTISVGDNNTFVMPNYAVNVSATFKENNTFYNITQGVISHGSITVSKDQAKSGTIINMTATPETGYSLYAWYVYKTDDINTRVAVSTTGTNTGSFVMPAYGVTVLASFASGGNGDYVKVTSAPSDWSGEYILVYENTTTQGYVWTGVDEENCYTEKNISNNSIADDGMVSITIASMSGGYSVRVNGGTNNGKYVYGKSGENKLYFSTNASLNTLSYESNSVKITSNTSVMRFNNNSDQKRFRYFKSDTYNNQQPIQLYKKTSGSASVPTHTIQFYPNANGVEGTMNDQTVNEFEPTPLNSNTFTRQGYAFDSWNTADDGSGTTYFDRATISLLSDLTLYAQWAQTYPITLAQVENGSISTGGITEAVEGVEITLTATPNTGYEFDYWLVTTTNGPVEVEGNSFVMPGCAVTVSAVFVIGVPFAQQYYLVTSTDHLVAGRTYLIVNSGASGSAKALSTTQNNNNRSATDVTIDNEENWPRIASIGNDVCELILGGNTGEWTFFDSINNGYLCAASSSANQLKTQTDLNNNGKWAISFADGGKATIQAQGTNTHNLLQYNSQSTIFSCYTSGQQDVYLFIKGKEFDYPESAIIAHLLPSDKHTVHGGATLTVTGTATSGDASHVVLEDGAQLVHHNDGVKATMKKTIYAYSGEGGWYTIAAPFVSLTPTTDNGLIANDYDLYEYVENGPMEWYNYKPNGNFNLVANKGYLYANSTSKSLRMAGELKPGNYSPTIDLSYANSDANLTGWNLLGNPTAHEISFTKTESVSDGYYYLRNSEIWVYEPSNIVPVACGFLVKANAADQTVTLNPQNRGYREEKDQYLCLSIGEEKAYVKLNEGVSMPLMDLNGQHSSLYLTQERKPYIMLVRDDADALDLCFEAHQEGMQTLTVDTQGLDLDYLHLIDHKTGADVDLLTTPSYTFEASEGDYATRFRLAFAPIDSPSTGSDAFAYWADGEIRLIAEPQGTAMLQVMDLTGRIIVSRDVARHVSTIGMMPGMYVLRLVTDDNVRVQKIVVK